MKRNFRPDKPQRRGRKTAGVIVALIAIAIMVTSVASPTPILQGGMGFVLLLISAVILSGTTSQQQ